MAGLKNSWPFAPGGQAHGLLVALADLLDGLGRMRAARVTTQILRVQPVQARQVARRVALALAGQAVGDHLPRQRLGRRRLPMRVVQAPEVVRVSISHCPAGSL